MNILLSNMSSSVRTTSESISANAAKSIAVMKIWHPAPINRPARSSNPLQVWKKSKPPFPATLKMHVGK
ncbi:hypothetical protein [Cedecea colo]|uniref:Uncharacterized protein n=1 Tax=Cedecea colo TaxID=2552946 RepID=A0ABX0VPD2_9ENTR|nr:hypothetical protein [Cedecea colo]NIY48653.1 hypothetical protein [Cedecea colo]